MKKLYSLVLAVVCSFGLLQAQTVNNPGFENWENVGSSTEEPNDWNSFMTASGSLTMFAQQQLVRSAVVRPGTTGTYSALMWSRSTMGIVANGNLTTGQINMGNVVPTNSSNYNISITSNPAFNEAFTSAPDSIAFWVKFVPASGNTTDSGRMRAVIHDSYDFRDPMDATSPTHIYMEATAHFCKTNGWRRFAVPFTTGPASTPAYILITFTTNKTPGGGGDGDSLYVDDLEFIYSGIGIKEVKTDEPMSVYANQNGQLIARFNFTQMMSTDIRIYDITGQQVLAAQRDLQSNTESFDISGLNAGLYFIQASRSDGMKVTKKFVIR